MPEPLTITTQDSINLHGSLYLAHGSARSTIIINSGVAVRRRFYEKFATFLSHAGFNIVTYDYRGIGDSLHVPIQQSQASIAQWASLDFPAVIDTVHQRFSGIPIQLVGHSFGGQILGMANNHPKIRSMLSVATQSGYWKLWPMPQRLAMGALWYGVMPALTRCISYFPARRLGFGENLPAPVARQWAAWCRDPNYLLNDADAQGCNFFADYTGPIRSISFDDDYAAPPRAVDALHAKYRNARVERCHVKATESEYRKIGHFGFFKQLPESELWQQSVNWLQETSQ